MPKPRGVKPHRVSNLDLVSRAGAKTAAAGPVGGRAAEGVVGGELCNGLGAVAGADHAHYLIWADVSGKVQLRQFVPHRQVPPQRRETRRDQMLVAEVTAIETRLTLLMLQLRPRSLLAQRWKKKCAYRYVLRQTKVRLIVS